METIYLFQGVVFRWDSEKARSNREKHGVDFEEAAEAILDLFGRGGDASTSQERREYHLGFSDRERLLLVVSTERAGSTRIISARPATRMERRTYERS